MKTRIFFISLIFAMCATSAFASEQNELGFRDASIIFGTGLTLQVGSLMLVEYEEAAPFSAILFLGTGIAMDLVGDALGHNGNMLATFLGTLGGTIVGAGLGWAIGHSLENSNAGKTEEFLATATVLSIGPLVGTLAYHWSNQPKTKASVSLMPTTLESPSGRRVHGMSMMGSF